LTILKEACAIGTYAAMDPEDAVITAYRWFYFKFNIIIIY
jgi:TPP-dependent pyruvate/acetoin dehydrogenase alpha subunit